MRTFNLKLILWLAGIFLVTAVGVHFTHKFQVRRNAGAYLDLATIQDAAVRDGRDKALAGDKTVNFPELSKTLESANNNYRRYLALNPTDYEARAKYGRLLLDMAANRNDFPRAYFQFERVLRDIPATADEPADQAANEKLEKEIRTEHVKLATSLGRFNDAIAHLETLKTKAAAQGEKNEVLLGLTEQQADCKLALNDTRGAQELLNAVLDPEKGDPRRVSAHRQLIRVLLRDNDPTEARKAALRMKNACPDDPDAMLVYADFLLNDNRPDNDPARTRKKKIEEARIECAKALELRPDDPDGLTLAAQAALRETSAAGKLQPDFEAARKYLRASLALKPDVAGRWELLARVELDVREKDRDEVGGLIAAMVVLQEGVDAVPDPQANLELRYYWLELLIGKEGTAAGLTDEEKARLESLLAEIRTQLGERPVVAYLDAFRLFAQQQWQTARTALENVQQAFQAPQANNQPVPGAARLLPRIRSLLAQCYSQLGNDDLKVATYKEIVDRDRFDPDAVRSYAEALLSVGRFDEGLAEYERWWTMVGSDPEVDQFKRYFVLRFNAAARLPRRGDQRSGALRVLNEMLSGYAGSPAAKSDPWPVLMRVDLAMALDRATRPAEAPVPEGTLGVSPAMVDQVKQWLSVARTSPELQSSLPIWVASVELAQRLNDPAADELWKELEKNCGDTFDVRLAKARYLINAKGKDALPELTALAENLPSDVTKSQRASLNFLFGRLCLSVDEEAEGLKYLLKAVELAPGQLPIRIMALQTAQQARDLEAANQLADEIEKISPDSDDAHYAKAVTYLTKYVATDEDKRDRTDLDSAEVELRAALAVRPNWALPHIVLGMIEGERGNSDGMAQEYHTALNLGANDPRLVVVAVNWLTRRGKLAEADELIQKIEATGGGETSQVAEMASAVATELEDFDRAIEKRWVAISGGMTNAQQYLALAYLYKVQGDWERVTQNLQDAIAADTAEGTEGTGLPYVMKVQMFMARSLQTADKAEAEKLVAEAKATAVLAAEQTNLPASVRVQRLAQCEDLLGNTEAAARMFQEAEAASPNDVTLQEAAARFYARYPALHGRAQLILNRFLSGELKRKDAAEADLLIWARREMALILADSGTYEGFEAALKLSRENIALLETDEAKKDSSKGLDRLAEKENLARILASRDLRSYQKEAIKLLEERAKLEPAPSLDTEFLRARLYLASGRWPEADKLMAHIVAIAQQSADRTMDRSSEAHASLAQYVNAYISALLAHGAVTEAQGWIAVWRRSDPGSFGATLAEARALVPRPQPQVSPSTKEGDEKKKGEEKSAVNVAEALESLENAVTDRTLSSEETQSRTLVAVLTMEDLLRITLAYGTPVDAELLKTRIRDYYQRIIDADPKRAQERQLMQVRFLVLAGERPRAVEVLKQHWQQAKVETLFIACAALLDYTEELKKLEQAGTDGKLSNEEVERQKKEILTTVGEAELITQQALVKTQQELAAAGTLSEVEKYGKANDVTTLLSLLGGHYLASKRYDDAMQAYTQILALAPGNIIALNNRAMIMAGTKTNLPEALSQIDEAIQRVGPAPLIVDSKAMVLHASGKYPEALEAAKQVIAEAPDNLDPVRNPDLAKRWGGFYFHLALMYEANKDQPSAAAAMQKARELGFGEADVSDLEMGLWKEMSGK